MARLVILLALALVLVAACGDAGTEAASTTSTQPTATTTSVTSASTTTSTATPPTTTTTVIDLSEGDWARVPHDEAIFGGDYDQVMLSVVAGGPGLVAVGYNKWGHDRDAAVWTSPDGLTWARVPHDEAIFGGDNDQEMRSVVAGGPGLVAVGRSGSESWSRGSANAAVWYWTPERPE